MSSKSLRVSTQRTFCLNAGEMQDSSPKGHAELVFFCRREQVQHSKQWLQSSMIYLSLLSLMVSSEVPSNHTCVDVFQ